MGFVSLHTPSADLPSSPCVVVGWRLACQYWGKGFATEGARGALHVGFNRLGLREIVSFTAVRNFRSRGVMARLGMHESGVFEHPHVPESSGLRQHCLYRLSREDYDAQSGSWGCLGPSPHTT
ncbi:MAG: GNAT family N-acetyltransferase [Beggiatoa sp.]|nr:GNAT family N-acetyltransferase [Beggiatoa sp.]